MTVQDRKLGKRKGYWLQWIADGLILFFCTICAVSIFALVGSYGICEHWRLECSVAKQFDFFVFPLHGIVSTSWNTWVMSQYGIPMSQICTYARIHLESIPLMVREGIIIQSPLQWAWLLLIRACKWVIRESPIICRPWMLICQCWLRRKFCLQGTSLHLLRMASGDIRLLSVYAQTDGGHERTCIVVLPNGRQMKQTIAQTAVELWELTDVGVGAIILGLDPDCFGLVGSFPMPHLKLRLILNSENWCMACF